MDADRHAMQLAPSIALKRYYSADTTGRGTRMRRPTKKVPEILVLGQAFHCERKNLHLKLKKNQRPAMQNTGIHFK
jgi:hypothetical protein